MTPAALVLAALAEAPASPLSLSLKQVAVPKPQVALRVENRGPSPVRVIRPRTGLLDQYGAWGGWSLRLEAGSGPCEPFPFPGAVQPVTWEDAVELRPGDSFEVLLRFQGWGTRGPGGAWAVKGLSAPKGACTVQVVYRPIPVACPPPGGGESQLLPLTPLTAMGSLPLKGVSWTRP